MDAGSIVTDFDKTLVLLLEPVDELDCNVASHDLGDACNLSLLLLVLAEHQSAGFLVEDCPRLSTAMRSWFVHQNLGKLDLLGRYL